MLCLLFLIKIKSNTFTKTISSDGIGYVKIPNQYNKADIDIAAGQALMLVEWDDAVIEIKFSEDQNSNIFFTKDTGLSLFTFKNDASIHIEFKSSVSFYYFHLPEELNSRIHVNNINSDIFTLDSQKLLKRNYLYSVEQYRFSGDPSVNCLFYRCFYEEGSPNCGDFGYTNGGNHLQDFSYVSIEQESFCKSGLKVILESENTFNPTIPTVFDKDLSDIIDNSNKYKENLAYGGKGNDFKQDQISSLKTYNYVFIRNDISKNADQYKLVITTENDQKQLQKGEMFQKGSSTSFKANISISSIKCNPENILTITAKPIQMTEDNQIEIIKFTDSDIPDNCLIKSEESKPKFSPGIIAAIVIAVVVVVVVIIVAVVIVIKKRKANNSSQEGNANAEDA